MASLELITQSESVGFRPANNVTYTGLSQVELACGNYQRITPIVPMGGLQQASPGNLRKDVGYGLIERYDFSGHNGTSPHINYDLNRAKHRFTKKALGDNHTKNLW